MTRNIRSGVNRITQFMEEVNTSVSIIDRTFCVKCGRMAFITDGKYECLGGHWMRYVGSRKKIIAKNIPNTWADAGVVDPDIRIAEIEGVFCVKCGQSAYRIGDENRYECHNGHVMDYIRAD